MGDKTFISLLTELGLYHRFAFYKHFAATRLVSDTSQKRRLPADRCRPISICLKIDHTADALVTSTSASMLVYARPCASATAW